MDALGGSDLCGMDRPVVDDTGAAVGEREASRSKLEVECRMACDVALGAWVTTRCPDDSRSCEEADCCSC